MNSIPERWNQILGYPKYEASSLGNIRSFQSGTPRILKASSDKDGYGQLTVFDAEGKRCVRKVHLLVALAFLGPRPEGLQVRHLDGNKLRNVPENLRWGTAKENAEDRALHGTHRNTAKTACKNGHEYTPDTMRFDTYGRRICVICNNAWQREYRQKNLEKARGWDHARAETNARKEYERKRNVRRVAERRAERERIRVETESGSDPCFSDPTFGEQN